MAKIQYFTEVKQNRKKGGIVLKRIFDIIASAILIVLLLPLLVLFSLLLLIFSGKPIFFKQVRVGQHNKHFVILKFRTMVLCTKVGRIHRYDWTDEVPSDFVFKTPSTQKITAIGKIYRKLSIDELPQLFNVLKGDMSLVGPRPEIPEITKFYNGYQRRRLDVKPGITGHAQVNGRSIISHGEKIDYDRYYIDHQSFLLDMKILLKTIGQALFGKGAY